MAAVPGLIVPTEVATLIVPSATVAEIIPNPPNVMPLPAVEPWVCGYFRWRNYPVTLVSFERLAGDREIPRFQRVCVLYPLPGRAPHDYFAVGMTGDPRGLEIPDSAGAASVPARMSPGLAAGAIEVGGRTLVIPDFDALNAAFYPNRPDGGAQHSR